MEQLRGAWDGPVPQAEREEDERVLGAIEKYLRRLNVDMSKVMNVFWCLPTYTWTRLTHPT